MTKYMKRFIVPIMIMGFFLALGIIAYANRPTTTHLSLALNSAPISGTNSTVATSRVTTRTGTSRSIRSRAGSGPSPSWVAWASAGGGSTPLRIGAGVSQQVLTNQTRISGQGQRVPMGQSTWDTRETETVSRAFNWR